MKNKSSLKSRQERRRRSKIGEYKEDCTDGKFSIINPKSFKGDVVVQAWIDARELATISDWLDKSGSFTRFLSEVVKDSLHLLCGELVDSGEVDMVEDSNKARYMLEKKYRVNLNPNRRGEKNALHNKVLSDRKREEREKIPDNIKELQRDAKETYREIEREENDKNSIIFKELERIERGEIEVKPQINNSQEYTMANDGNIVKNKDEDKDEDKVVKSEDAAEFVKVSRERSEEDIPLLKEKGNSREVIEARIRKADEESQKELDALNNMDFTSLIGSAVKEK